MDLQDQTRVGRHTFGVSAKSEPAQDGQPAAVAVEFTGAAPDGQVVAEGNLLIALDGLGDATAFLSRTLGGLAALHGKRASGQTGGRARPPNAGQPWIEEHNEELRRRWMCDPAPTSAHALLGELAEEFGRSRAAVRAQLPRLGYDPDVPGRVLNGGKS